MLNFLNSLIVPVLHYKESDQYNSIFKEISENYYYENYHSDILAYYLKRPIVKKYFIDWLNHRTVNNKSPILFEDYQFGEVFRERGRIDLLIFSNDKNSAIIVENKSNDASDQARQIFRYFYSLEKQGISVDRIFYLNKNSNKLPELADLNDEERKQIKEKTVVGQLVGHNSFTEKVINQVLIDSNDIRLSAISQEIRDLFYSVTYGEINMEDLSSFVTELKQNDNLSNLKKAILAYQDLPVYFTAVYKNYIMKKETGHKIFLHKPNCLVIDHIFRFNKQFAIDIWFYPEKLDFSILCRNGNDSDIENLRSEMGSRFPFKEFSYGRYRFFYDDPFNDEAIKKILDELLNQFKKA